MYFGLTDKYEEHNDLFPLSDDLDNWNKRTKNHIKLLSLLCGWIDGNIAERFQLDDILYDAIENEFEYSGFTLTKSEINDGVIKLMKLGYLEKK